MIHEFALLLDHEPTDAGLSSGGVLQSRLLPQLAAASGVRDRLPDRANLQGDQVVKLVPLVWSGSQAEPAPGRDLLDRVQAPQAAGGST
jgi:hypothetical protein